MSKKWYFVSPAMCQAFIGQTEQTLKEILVSGKVVLHNIHEVFESGYDRLLYLRCKNDIEVNEKILIVNGTFSIHPLTKEHIKALGVKSLRK